MRIKHGLFSYEVEITPDELKEILLGNFNLARLPIIMKWVKKRILR
jgi:hypothetical protein